MDLDAAVVAHLDAAAHEHRAYIGRLCDVRGLAADERRRILRHAEELAYRLRALALDLRLQGAEGVGDAILHPPMVSKDERGQWPDGSR